MYRRVLLYSTTGHALVLLETSLQGTWIYTSGGIGAGGDSFYEYLLKAYILLDYQDCGVDFWNMFRTSYEAIVKHMYEDSWFHEAEMSTGLPTHYQVTSLQAFWPGVQALTGDVQADKDNHALLFSIWQAIKV